MALRGKLVFAQLLLLTSTSLNATGPLRPWVLTGWRIGVGAPEEAQCAQRVCGGGGRASEQRTHP